MTDLTMVDEPELLEQLTDAGHSLVRASSMRVRLAQHGSLQDWPAFSDSWNDMPLDGYMADGGRYRRRRHAVFAVDAAGQIQRQPHQPHYQSRHYNSLNGGIPRWFEPLLADGDCLQTILRFCQAVFGAAAPEVMLWHVEVHQFRIEARSDVKGQPTPEGVHRDGVDYVLVLLITRQNIARGMTEIFTPDHRPLGHFTLTDPFDAVLVDDNRVHHGVTAVVPIDPEQPAWRDVLVVTFRRDQGRR
jgi:hypothetical protein